MNMRPIITLPFIKINTLWRQCHDIFRGTGWSHETKEISVLCRIGLSGYLTEQFQ